MFPALSPFHSEMRRRVWAVVRQADLLLSVHVSLPTMIRSTDSDTEKPRNLYDEDFDENSKELPDSRPMSEPTPISYLIAKSGLTLVFGRVIEHVSAQGSTSYDSVLELDAELRRSEDLIPDHLRLYPGEECLCRSSADFAARLSVSGRDTLPPFFFFFFLADLPALCIPA